MPEELGDLEFWDAAHRAGSASRECYGAFDAFTQVLDLYMHRGAGTGAERVLQLGCGTSSLAEGLWRKGWTQVTSVDWSAAAVEKCRERDRYMHGLDYLCLDASDMSVFPDASFDYVVEKGCLDTIFCSLGCLRKVARTLAEVARVLRPGGYFISLSAAPRECRFPHLQRPEFEWSVDSVRVPGEPAFFAYACKKRAFHREWFFADASALALAEAVKTKYSVPATMGGRAGRAVSPKPRSPKSPGSPASPPALAKRSISPVSQVTHQ
jgi:SAM-dependent methyltransferase